MRTALGMVLAVCVVGHVAAGESPVTSLNVQVLRFDGRLGPPAPHHVAAADLMLDAAGQRARMQVESLDVLMGDILAADVLAELYPLRPSLFLRGPEELVRRFGAARPGDHVVLTGYRHSGSRDLFLSAVEVEAAP